MSAGNMCRSGRRVTTSQLLHTRSVTSCHHQPKEVTKNHLFGGVNILISPPVSSLQRLHSTYCTLHPSTETNTTQLDLKRTQPEHKLLPCFTSRRQTQLNLLINSTNQRKQKQIQQRKQKMAQKDKVKHKRRYCRIPDCGKIVKSQGLCQRHGAKTRKCKVAGCEKQAQGNFDGMCKLHFKITKTQLIAKAPTVEEVNLGPVGESVYDRILPESIGWTDETDAMPLVKHLKDGFDQSKPRGWHRNEERRSRGLTPVINPAIQLEGWERELVWMEICLLSGSPQSSFRHLARSWGRDKGFHMVLAQFICERRGNVERKKRVKGDSVTKKSRRAPVELAPSGEDLPTTNNNNNGNNGGSMEDFDDVDLDMLGVLEGCEDPTVNFTHVPDFSNYAKRTRRQPRQPVPPVIVDMSATMQPEAYHHHHQEQQQQQQHVPPQHTFMNHHHAVLQQQQHLNIMVPQTIAPAPAMMGGGKILTHEALICEEPPQQQQQQQQQHGMYDASVPV